MADSTSARPLAEGGTTCASCDRAARRIENLELALRMAGAVIESALELNEQRDAMEAAL